MNPLAQVVLTCGAMLPFNGGIPAIYFADKSILQKNAARQPLLHSPPWPSFLVIMSFAFAASALAYICSVEYRFSRIRTMNVGTSKCCKGIGTSYGWRIHIIAHPLAWALAIIQSSMSRTRSVFHSSPENLHRPGILASSHVLFGICVLLLTPLTLPTVVWTGIVGSNTWIEST